MVNKDVDELMDMNVDLSSVCVSVCLFLYTGGDLNLNTHRLVGTCVTVGT